jgi:hypothetical protein
MVLTSKAHIIVITILLEEEEVRIGTPGLVRIPVVKRTKGADKSGLLLLDTLGQDVDGGVSRHRLFLVEPTGSFG